MKSLGNGFFDAANKGAQEAAKEIGDVEVIYTGPTSATAEGQIEIASVGFMRGRTLNNAFIVVDEAQNCTYVQLKMILTRLGWNSKMVVTGDPAQSDLLPELSGLSTVADRIETVRGVGYRFEG